MKSMKLGVYRSMFGRVALGVALLTWPLAAYALNAPRYAEQTRTTPPTAFLHHKVYSASRLVAQLKADPGAQKGYAKLFHIPASQVVPFIEGHCAATTLTETGKYTVYRVTAQGTIYPTLQKVPRGATVFAVKTSSEDIPRFISAMGDPMKPFKTAVNVRVVHVPSPTRVITEVSPSQEMLVPTEPVQTVVPATTTAYSTTASAPANGNAPANTQPATTSGVQGK